VKDTPYQKPGYLLVHFGRRAGRLNGHQLWGAKKELRCGMFKTEQQEKWPFFRSLQSQKRDFLLINLLLKNHFYTIKGD
jgi:hypothetical protein